MQLRAATTEGKTMNRILKISLISAGGAVATAIVSGISYVKGKKDGMLLMQKKFESQLNAAPTDRTHTQPQA